MVNEKDLEQLTREPVVYGRISEVMSRKNIGVDILGTGEKRNLFYDWGDLHISGDLVKFVNPTPYSRWATSDRENLCLVEKGSGILTYQGREYPVEQGHVFKIFHGQEPEVNPNGELLITSIQMPSLEYLAVRSGEDLSSLKVVNPNDIPKMVFEYEALGQEVVPCKYAPGMGLVLFTTPIDRFPLHQHRFAARFIRPISGKGYNYVEPQRYEMDDDTFVLFPKKITHTNGPIIGSTYKFYAVQLPWIEPKIDCDHQGGSDEFVTWLEGQPPKELWKKVDDFYRIMEQRKMNE